MPPDGDTPAQGPITTLPLEILHEIGQHLLQDSEVEIGATSQPSVPTPSRRALISLATTSRSLCVKQRQLLRTLTANPTLADYDKDIYLFEYDEFPVWQDQPLRFSLQNMRRRDPEDISGTGLRNTTAVLWRAIRLEEPTRTRRWDNSTRYRAVRDAMLDLFELLLNVPRLAFFHYGSTVDDVTIPLEVDQSVSWLVQYRLFETMFALTVKDLKVSPVSFLRKLGLLSKTVNPIRGPVNATSRNLRELKLCVTRIDMETLRTLQSGLESLEVLNYKHPLSEGDDGTLIEGILSAIDSRCETLKKLYVQIMSRDESNDISSFLPFAHHSWNSYSKLTELRIPDVLLYNEQTTLDNIVVKLLSRSPAIPEVVSWQGNVREWSRRRNRMLRRDALPNLTQVGFAEPPPDMSCDRLLQTSQIQEPEVTTRGVLFQKINPNWRSVALDQTPHGFHGLVYSVVLFATMDVEGIVTVDLQLI
ncbi:hypothetical protein BJX70DRAFT_402727 [Aspergillus crustosus]